MFIIAIIEQKGSTDSMENFKTLNAKKKEINKKKNQMLKGNGGTENGKGCGGDGNGRREWAGW